MLNTAVVAPMQSASVATTIVVNAGLREQRAHGEAQIARQHVDPLVVDRPCRRHSQTASVTAPRQRRRIAERACVPPTRAAPRPSIRRAIRRDGARGTSRAMTAEQRRAGRIEPVGVAHVGAAWRRGERARQPGKATGGVVERLHAGAGDLVVAARRPLRVARVGDGLPARAEHAGVLEASQDRIDRSALEAGGVHDVEAVAEAAADGEEDDGGGVGEADRSGHGVLCIYRSLHR